MISWALTFVILAVVAGILGFGGMAGTFAWAAQILFVAFVVLALVFAVTGRKPPIT